MNHLLQLKIASMMLFWFGIGVLIIVMLLVWAQYSQNNYISFFAPYSNNFWYNVAHSAYYLGHFIHILSAYWLSKGKKIGWILGLAISVYEIVSFFVPELSPRLQTSPAIAFRVIVGIIIALLVLGRNDLQKLQTENWRPWKSLRAKKVTENLSPHMLKIQKFGVICSFFLMFVITITVLSFLLKYTNIDSTTRYIIEFASGGFVVWLMYRYSGGGSLTKIVGNTNPYFARKKYKQAAQLYEQIIPNDPNNYKLLYRTGYSYMMIEEYETALKYLDDAQKIKQDDPELLATIGYLHLNKDNYENAIKFSDDALKIRIDYDAALFCKGLAKYFQNQKDEAAFFLKKAISQNPSKFRKLIETVHDLEPIKKDEEFKKRLE